MRVVDAVADWFEAAGFDHYFGYAGGALWPLLDGLIDHPDVVGIQAKHESHAVHQADVYYRLTGKIAPVLVTKGPGLMNTVGGIASAYHDAIPILLIGGGGSTHFLGKAGMQEMFYKGHEDSVSVFRPITKGSWMCVRPDTVIDVLNHAYRTAMSGRPGPVYVLLPLDVQMGQVEGEIEPPTARSVKRSVRAGSDEISQAADLVRRAEKPILLLGGGTARGDTDQAISALVDAHPMPVMTTLTAKGVLPETHDLSLGPVGRSGTEAAARAARESDLVVAVGARFSDNHTSNWRQGAIYDVPRTKIIQVDIDPTEVGRNYPVELGLESDAKAFLTDLNAALGSEPVDRSGWIDTVKGYRDEWRAEIASIIGSTDSPIHPGRMAYDVGEALAERGRVFIDVGDVIQYAEPYMTVHRPHTWYINAGMAEMGWASQGAPAAVVADPKNPAVVMTGDGAFLMGPQVLATAIEYGLGVVWVILNNYELGIERKGAGAAFGRNHPWITFTTPDGEPYNPDFAAMARSYGADGHRIDKTEDFRPALEAAIASGRPTVLDVPIDTSPPSYFTKGLDRAYPTDWGASYPSYGLLSLKKSGN
ncbi:MAG TPA: thiamine pyrophosphate-binding protein [Acidimicrobiia bacterium]|nr:thiamine pyrophosphate-binding protein [Acidimicrobiia bacterium]